MIPSRDRLGRGGGGRESGSPPRAESIELFIEGPALSAGSSHIASPPLPSVSSALDTQED